MKKSSLLKGHLKVCLIHTYTYIKQKLLPRYSPELLTDLKMQ